MGYPGGRTRRRPSAVSGLYRVRHCEEETPLINGVCTAKRAGRRSNLVRYPRYTPSRVGSGAQTGPAGKQGSVPWLRRLSGGDCFVRLTHKISPLPRNDALHITRESHTAGRGAWPVRPISGRRGCGWRGCGRVPPLPGVPARPGARRSSGRRAARTGQTCARTRAGSRLPGTARRPARFPAAA